MGYLDAFRNLQVKVIPLDDFACKDPDVKELKLNTSEIKSVPELHEWMSDLKKKISLLKYTLNASEKIDLLLKRLRKQFLKDLPACLMINSLNKEILSYYQEEFKKKGYETALWNPRGPSEWLVYYSDDRGSRRFDDFNDRFGYYDLNNWEFEDEMFENSFKNCAFFIQFNKAIKSINAMLEVECDDLTDPEMEYELGRAPRARYPLKTYFLVVLL